MSSPQSMQKAAEEVKDIIHRELAFFDEGGCIASTTEEDESLQRAALYFLQSQAQAQQAKGYTFFKILLDGGRDGVLAIEGEGEDTSTYGRLIAAQTHFVAEGTEELYDKNRFFQNLLLGNLLAPDVLSQMKRLHIIQTRRVVFVIDVSSKGDDDIILELVRNLSDMQGGDAAVTIDEHRVVLIKDISDVQKEKMESRLDAIADSLVDNLQTEAMVGVRVGFGNPVEQVSQLPQSYQEACMALAVAKEFYAERETISYGRLGIGRLIYQLPMSLCEMYIKEIFGENIPDVLDDEESMNTINVFFENNLNISETARKLYVHRNTLVYRLERIQRSVGLDIRKFDDAMTFRIAVMVLSHMRQNQ